MLDIIFVNVIKIGLCQILDRYSPICLVGDYNSTHEIKNWGFICTITRNYPWVVISSRIRMFKQKLSKYIGFFSNTANKSFINVYWWIHQYFMALVDVTTAIRIIDVKNQAYKAFLRHKTRIESTISRHTLNEMIILIDVFEWKHFYIAILRTTQNLTF